MNTLNWLVRLSYIKHDHFTCKIFIINLNRLNVLLWNQNQFLISYPGTEQYNLLILNSARVASYAKVTGSLSTLELTRYRLPLQQTSTTQHQGQGSSTISTPSWRFTLRFSRRCSTRFFPDSAFVLYLALNTRRICLVVYYTLSNVVKKGLRMKCKNELKAH